MKRSVLAAFVVLSGLVFVGCATDSTTVLGDVGGGDVTADPGTTADVTITGDGVEKDSVTPADTVQPGDTAQPCSLGAAECLDDHTVRICKAGGVWSQFACPEGELCIAGDCAEGVCVPNALRCKDEHTVEICAADASAWADFKVCADNEVCIEGACVAALCAPGEKACAGTTVLTCAADGSSWDEEPCPGDAVCFDGACLECVYDEHCDEGLVCDKGACVPPALKVLTTQLPHATKGQAYQSPLEATGGDGTYTWSTADDLPAGVTLSAEGSLAGTPTEAGDFPFTAKVTDGSGQQATGELTLSVVDLSGSNLVITTGSPLPQATEGEPYSTVLKATGGTEPYGWFIIGGALPAGLNMVSTGELAGTPTEIGTFNFTVRVVDAATPVGFAAKDFALTVKVAPLEIVADQIYDVWIAKIVILPMLTIVPGIPLPYNQQLQAKGGLKPYHWSEYDVPGIDWLLPKAGVPAGLTLGEDGKLSGSVTDTSLVMELSIPFTQIKLTGFFFGAKVVDSNNPQDSDTGLFLIPTLPVAL